MKNEVQKKDVALVKSNGNGAEKSYAAWIADLKRRYRATQIKAAVAVNSALIEFYWNLGKDISEKYPGEVYGGKFFDKLGIDLQRELPGASGFTKVNLIYCLKFYELYSTGAIVPQVVEQSVRRGNGSLKMPQVAAKCYRPQVVDDKIMQQLVAQLVSVPWGHHRTIIDKCKGDRDKALFYVRRTVKNGWSRNSLLNWLSTDLYEREGKAQTNFELTMPSDDCDLARQIVKDPQNFETRNLACRWASRITSSRRFSPPRRNWQSASPTQNGRSNRFQPQRAQRTQRVLGREDRNEGENYGCWL